MRIYNLIFSLTLFLISGKILTRDTSIFNSLPITEQYAGSVAENPKIHIADWENPDFSPYYKQTIPTFFRKVLISTGLLHPLWDIESFTQLLTQVTSSREYAGYATPFIQKMEPIPGSNYYIFSDLVGAFHSLVRDLRYMQQQGIINESFKIIKPNSYIIFNGNIASRSAYALETLTVILRVLAANTDNAFVTLGSNEMDRHWQHYAIKHELKIRAAKLQVERLPLGSIMERFFNTLPSALYLVADRTQNDISVVRISNVGFENKIASATTCSNFFEQPQKTFCSINIKEQPKSTTDITIRALIRGDPFYKTRYTTTQGLSAAGKEEGAVTWTTISGPIQASQELFQFYHDAYVKLSTAKSLEDWTLTLYNRDIREHSPMQERFTVKLLSRQELNPIETIEAQLKIITDEKKYLEQSIAALDKKIVIQETGGLEGKVANLAIQATPANKEKSSDIIEVEKSGPVPLGKNESAISVTTVVDLSGLTKQEGESIETGIKIVFNSFNKKSGAENKTLELITVDSKREKGVPLQGIIKNLKKNKSGLILVPLSTWALEDYLDLVTKKQLLVLFPAASGSDSIRNKDLRNIIFLRASGQQEAFEITNYTATNLGGKKFVLFYTNNSFGKASLRGAQEALKKLNITDYIAVQSEENNVNFTEQVKIIKQFNSDSIGMFCVQEAAKELLNQLGFAWLTGKKLFGTQDLSPQSFRNYIDRNKLQFVCTSVVPNPAGSLEIAKQYSKATEQLPILNDIYCFEAYIGADLFTYILQQIKQPITCEKIIDFIEHIHNLEYKGLTLDFDAENRQLLHSLWLITNEKEWKELKLTKSEKPTRPASPASQEKLYVGSILDLSRGDAVLGNIIKRVMEYLIDQANNTKAKDKPFIDLTVIDHEYAPEKARKAAETLLSTYHADIILCTLGSQPYKSFIDYIEKGDIITLFPTPGIPGKRYNLPHAVFLGASYYEEARIITGYCIEHLNIQNLVILYQDDLFGQALFDGAKKVLATKKVNFTAIAYERNRTNFSHQIEQIKQINPDTIGLFATPEASIEFLRQLGEPYIKKIHFFGPSDLSPQIVQDFITKNEVQCIRSNIVPDPTDQSLPLCKEFQEAMKAARIKPDTTAFETYISTEIFIDAVNKIKGIVNKESILQEIENIRNIQFKGLPLNFDPKTHQLLHAIWIDEGKQTPWQIIPLNEED